MMSNDLSIVASNLKTFWFLGHPNVNLPGALLLGWVCAAEFGEGLEEFGSTSASVQISLGEF